MTQQPLDLDPIRRRARIASTIGELLIVTRQDVPALIIEVERLRELLDQRTADIADKALENAALRAQLAELTTYATGCDGEGCVLPHSSWCDRAKKQAAEQDGCTCPMPWPGTPQPHAGYCWLVSPPKDELEQVRAAAVEANARVDELEAENQRLRTAWHSAKARASTTRERLDHTEFGRDRAIEAVDQLQAVLNEMPRCHAPHPVADDSRCDLVTQHPGWHAAQAGAWPRIPTP